MPLPPIPFPDAPADQRTTAKVELRYEDVDQDGLLKLESMPNAIAAVAWRGLLADHPLYTAGLGTGILPILNRLVLQGGEGPLSIVPPVEARGGFHLATARKPDGSVDRLMLTLFAELWGEVGHTHGSGPQGAGTRIQVGRALAEHVFTRPFGPPAERKVMALPEGAWPAVPEASHAWRSGEELGQIPDGATALEAEPATEAHGTVFGLVHTDSNLHVNSLVYPRLFEEGALRRLAALGRAPAGGSRQAELAFRKPCFAGDEARMRLQAFELGGAPGVAGTLLPPGGGRPYCYARLRY